MNDKLKVKPFCLDCFISWGHLPDHCEECLKLMEINTKEGILISQYGEAIQDLKDVIDQYKVVIKQYEEERNAREEMYNDLMDERNKLKGLKRLLKDC